MSNDFGSEAGQAQSGTLGATLGVAGAASTVVGLAADFGQPFGPFALYILLGAGALTILVAFLYLRAKTLRQRLRSPFVFLGVLTLVCSIMVLFQQMAGAEGEQRGGLAAVLKPLAALQNDMGIVKQDVAAIKKSAERTAKAVEKMAKGMEGLSKLGGLIANPTTVVDFYNNALVYERRGDALSAGKMYAKAIAKGVSAVDFHERYAALLKAQEGILGAREIYADLARNQPDNKAIALTKAVLQPVATREKALRTLVSGPKSFGPGWYQIARLYSSDRLGQQSLSDKRAEQAALEAFERADKAGDIYKHFLNKEIADKWRETVTMRIAPYRTKTADVSPISISAAPSSSGWIISFNLAEPARAIRYRINGGIINETGNFDITNQTTMAKQPRNFFLLPLDVEKASIDIWYDDVGGKEQGPFRQEFNAAAAHVRYARNNLENITPKWVSGRDFDGRFLVYFSQLVSYNCGLKAISYGIDTAVPNKSWPVPECDLKNPYGAVEDDKIYESFSQKIGSMSVQLTYSDGTKSPVKVFKF